MRFVTTAGASRRIGARLGERPIVMVDRLIEGGDVDAFDSARDAPGPQCDSGLLAVHQSRCG